QNLAVSAVGLRRKTAETARFCLGSPAVRPDERRQYLGREQYQRRIFAPARRRDNAAFALLVRVERGSPQLFSPGRRSRSPQRSRSRGTAGNKRGYQQDAAALDG